VNLEATAARLGVPVDGVERVHRLAGDRPSTPLPAKADTPAILERLAVRPDDAAEIMAGWPTPILHCGRRSCAGCSTARSPWSGPISGSRLAAPGPELPRDRGLAWRHLYVYAYLALVDVVRDYHRDHGIADGVSWVTLADLGRNLGIDRRMHGEGGRSCRAG
jgi:hypothetical protein